MNGLSISPDLHNLSPKRHVHLFLGQRSKTIFDSSEDICVCDKCLMGVPLIFCPIWKPLIKYAKGTLHKNKIEWPHFFERFTYKYVEKAFLL